MPIKALRTWNGSFVFGLLGVFAVSVSTANSIMDIINMEKVEKLLAERRENGSRDDQERRFLLQNSIDAEETFFPGEEDEDEGQTEDDPLDADPIHPAYGRPGVHRNRAKGHRYEKGRPHKNHRHNLTGVPDFSSVLADLTGAKADRILKSDNNPMLVTKKEYLRKDWCKTEPMVQKIREEGCLTRTILNRFCYGQCNSFYIPKNPPRKKRNRKRPPNEEDHEEIASFKSCGFCKPRRSTAILVTLRCPGNAPLFKKKKVQRIKQCKCIAENVGP